MSNLTVAKTIVQQIGNRAFFMMGTKPGELVGSDNSLSFKIRGSKKCSAIKITLNGSDLYDLEFIKIRKFERTIVEIVADIYFDGLHQCIERVTGLALSL